MALLRSTSRRPWVSTLPSRGGLRYVRIFDPSTRIAVWRSHQAVKPQTTRTPNDNNSHRQLLMALCLCACRLREDNSAQHAH